jgi:hypothetical protein
LGQRVTAHWPDLSRKIIILNPRLRERCASAAREHTQRGNAGHPAAPVLHAFDSERGVYEDSTYWNRDAWRKRSETEGSLFDLKRGHCH